MGKQKRGVWPAIGRLALGTLLLTSSCLPPARALAAGASDLSIGFIGTLSGANASIAQDQIDGFKLGIKHLGGKIGGAEFSLSVFDDRSDPDLASRAARQLLSAQPRAQFILLSSSSAVSAVLAPQVTAAHSFLVALAAPSASLAGRDCSLNFFSLSPLAETVTMMAGQYLQGLGRKSVVLIAPDTPRSKQEAADFAKGFHGTLTTVTSRPGEMDFHRDIARIRESAPDAVYLLLRGGMAVNFIIQYRQSDDKTLPPLFAPAGTSDQSMIAAVGDAAAGLFSVAPWSEDFDTPSNRRLVADFEVDYGRPASIFAAYGYDAAMLLDRAVAAVEHRLTGEDALRDALRHVDFPATRPGLRFDTDHFPMETYVAREVVEDAARGRLGNEQKGIVARNARNGHAGECPMRWPAEYVPPRTGG